MAIGDVAQLPGNAVSGRQIGRLHFGLLFPNPREVGRWAVLAAVLLFGSSAGS